MARLNVSLTNEMARKIQDAAESEGKTISSLMTESVDIYLKLKSSGLSKGEFMKLLRFQELMKSVNAVPIPALLLDLNISMAIESSENKTLELWTQRGKVLGEFFIGISPDLEHLSSEMKNYANLMPLNKMELRVDDNRIELLLMGTGFSIASSKATAAGLKGFLDVYGVKNMVETISEGFVKVCGTI